MNETYYVYTKKGLHKTFNSYYLLLNFIRLGRWQKFGHDFKDKRYIVTKIKDRWSFKGNVFLCGPTKLTPIKYIAKDNEGTVLNCKKLEDDAYNAEKFRPEYNYKFRRYYENNYLGFRNGPVPYTGYSRKKGYKYLRRMKTTQELRWNCAHKKFTRGKRRNLPTHYDGLIRKDTLCKHSWKKQKKKKQWM